MKKPFVLGSRFFRLDNDKFLDLSDSRVLTTKEIEKIKNEEDIEEIKEDVEIVMGKDSKEIECSFVNGGKRIKTSGYLVDVFLSTSLGLTKLGPSDVRDPLSEEIVLEGYENFFEILEKEEDDQ